MFSSPPPLPVARAPQRRILRLTVPSLTAADPQGFSEQFNVNYARASELKHGRVAMLATVGFVAQQSFHVIGDADPFKTIDAVGYMANIQILGAIGLVELATWDKTFSGTNPGACVRACVRL